MLSPALSVGGLQRAARVRTIVLLAAGFALAAIVGPAIGLLGPRAAAAAIGVILFLFFPIVCWRRPAASVLVLAGAALLFEQYPLRLGDQLTEQVLLFATLNTNGASGLFFSPIEVLLATALVIWLVRGMARRELRLPRSAPAIALAAFVLCVVVALVRGLAEGGDYRIIVDEVRPFLYVACVYLVAAETLRTRGRLWALLWVDVLATGFKGLQGTYRYLTVTQQTQSLLAHEEAIFFDLFTLLVAGLWLFGARGRLRRVATALLPFVVVANLANQRRVAWIILAFGLVVLFVAAWVSCPERRRLVVATAAAFAIGSAVYLPAFWNSTSTLAQPARGISSAFSPNQRDDSSNFYRVVENLDLGIAIRRSTPLGVGFGHPIPYAVPLPFDASTVDPLIVYIPHNSVLYVWLRTGLPGALAYWMLIGSATVLACRLLRSGDRQLALVGTFGLWTLVAYVFAGWFDAGLVQYRTAVLVGCVLGALEAARRIAQEEEEVTPAAAVPRLAPLRGSG
jgi:O-antigen ligase